MSAIDSESDNEYYGSNDSDEEIEVTAVASIFELYLNDHWFQKMMASEDKTRPWLMRTRMWMDLHGRNSKIDTRGLNLVCLFPLSFTAVSWISRVSILP